MEPERLKEMQILLARSALRSREEIIRYMNEALANGKKREAISWRANLRKVEKQIALYGLDRYAAGL